MVQFSSLPENPTGAVLCEILSSFFGVCLLLALWSSPAAGREIFVNNMAGDDRFSGQEPVGTTFRNGPLQTITKAMQLATGGDTIVLAKTNVPYHECVSLVGSRNSGTPGEPFLVRGNSAILDGSAPVPPAAWTPYRGAVFCFRPPHTAYQQLFLDDRPAVRVFASRTATAPPDLQPLQWCLVCGRIYFRVEQDKLPGDYRLSYASLQTGITLFHVDYVAIVDLIVQGFQLDGINLFDSAQHVSLIGVTCRGEGRSGVTVGGASLADMDLSLLGDNGQWQLLTLPCSETHVRSTHLLGNTARVGSIAGAASILAINALKGA